MTEEKLIQLTLTQPEALILGAITSLGIKTLRDNQEEAKLAKMLVGVLSKVCPGATISLARKMLLLAELSKKYAEEELLKVK